MRFFEKEGIPLLLDLTNCRNYWRVFVGTLRSEATSPTPPCMFSRSKYSYILLEDEIEGKAIFRPRIKKEFKSRSFVSIIGKKCIKWKHKGEAMLLHLVVLIFPNHLSNIDEILCKWSALKLVLCNPVLYLKHQLFLKTAHRTRNRYSEQSRDIIS